MEIVASKKTMMLVVAITFIIDTCGMLNGGAPIARAEALSTAASSLVSAADPTVDSAGKQICTSSSPQGGSANKEAQTDQPAQATGNKKLSLISKEKAIRLAGSFVDMPHTYKVTQALIDDPASHHIPDLYHKVPVTWIVTFAENTASPYWEIMLNAETGALLSFSKRDRIFIQKNPVWPKVSAKEARKVAEVFIKQVDADIVPELLNADGQYAYDQSAAAYYVGGKIYQYSFRITRMVGGIPFPQNGIYLTLDENGQIVEYNRSWDAGYQFANPACAIPADQAAEAFRKQISLAYVLPNGRGSYTPKLVYDYQPLSIMEAMTGKWVGYSGMPEPTIQSAPLDDQALGEKPVRQSQPLTKGAAVAQAKLLLGLDSNKYPNLITEESFPWGGIWVLNFKLKESDMLQVRIDKSTGIMTGYQHSIVMDTSAADTHIVDSNSAAAAEQAAVEFVKKAAPFAANQLFLEKYDSEASSRQEESGGFYLFRFIRIVNGAKVDFHELRVEVNKQTGIVVSYNAQFLPLEVPTSMPKTITLTQAQAAIEAAYRIEPVYSLFTDCGASANVSSACAKPKDAFSQKIGLFYHWVQATLRNNVSIGTDNGGVIDALSGDIISRSNGSKMVQETKDVASEPIGNQTEQVYIEQGKFYMAAAKPDPPRIPDMFTLTKAIPFYTTTDSKRKPAGMLGKQDVRVVLANVNWESGGKQWIKVKTWLGDMWIYGDIGGSVIPRLPKVISLLEATPIYAGKDDKAKPSAVLSPQDVIVVDADKDWYVFHGDGQYAGAKRWIRIKTSRLGDQWIHLEQHKIGALYKVDGNMYINDADLLSLPYTFHTNQSTSIMKQTVHITAEFNSVIQKSYQIETAAGSSWVAIIPK